MERGDVKTGKVKRQNGGKHRQMSVKFKNHYSERTVGIKLEEGNLKQWFLKMVLLLVRQSSNLGPERLLKMYTSIHSIKNLWFTKHITVLLGGNAKKFGREGFGELSSYDFLFLRKIRSEVISWEQGEHGSGR